MLQNSPLRSLVLVTALTALSSLHAQVEQGGSPASIGRSLAPPAGVRMPDVDLAVLAAQDAVNDLDKSIPWRFGKNHAVNFDLNNSGSWVTLPDGTRLWRLGIECPGALSVNFEFHDFQPIPGGKVFVTDQWGGHIGSFTTANDAGEHVLGVQSVKGSRITVEYEVPATGPIGSLRIGQITHGYRDIFNYARALGSSGSCNNNVICPEGDNWRDQIRAVAMITVSGSGICTGTLLNNCAQDGTPYFLTANHCLPGNLNVSTWVFRFNWESSSCAQNLNGPTNQTVSGASLLAHSGGSDVALLQLNSTPPASYNVYYTGWDKSGTFPTSQTAIHHPAGDIKKISFDYNAPTQGTYGSAACWHILAWDDGTTEPGSSGSGLWDQNNRLIGQLYGGDATCSNNVNDYYGRFDVSYPLLTTWLGSCGNTINGYDPNAPSVALDARVTGITGATATVCSSSITPSAVIRNGGTTTLTSFTVSWSVAGGGSGSIPWTGSLASNATVTIPLGTVALNTGANALTVTVTNPNGGVDQIPANNTATANSYRGTNPVTFNLTLDRYGEETTWLIRSGGVTIASGGPFTQAASNGAYPQTPITVCLADGCYELVVNDSFGDGMCCAYGNGSFTLTDVGGATLVSGGTFTTSSVNAFCVQSAISVNVQMMMEGPYGTGPLMSDALRSGGWIPATEPYTGLGYTHVGGGGEVLGANVLSTTGSNAIVDWVVIELRSGAPSYGVVATRSALLQRDGDVVDLNGTSPVTFNMPAGNYRVAVRHRNHLGAMTNATVALSSTPLTVDFRSVSLTTYGTAAQETIGGVSMLWAGDVNRDNNLIYTAGSNDRDPILGRIGGVVPTNSVSGYFQEDLNMDGTVLYTGDGNDRDLILQNIGGVIPTNIKSGTLP